jgi:hypothetical protein
MGRRPPPGRSDPLAEFRDTCRFCGDRTLRATGRYGERVPLNEAPSYFGGYTYRIEPAEGGHPAQLIATQLRPNQIAGARLDDRVLYRNHLNDCPDAKRAARKKPNRRKIK